VAKFSYRSHHSTNGLFVHYIVPQNLQLIPDNFFLCCTSLVDIRISASVQQIGMGAFSGSGIRSIGISEMLPPNLRSIKNYCFADCKSLTNIIIPVSVEQIGVDAFS